MISTRNRFDAIDSAKGIGIILVVFGHAWRGAYNAGVISDYPIFAAVDAGIYAFHMPLFFFLSGLLFLDVLREYNAGDLLRGRVTRLLWPMALWTWFFFGFKLIGGSAVNTPVTMNDMPLVPLPPYEHLWFLWALFLCQVILIGVYAALLRPLSDSALRLGAGGIGIALAAVLPSLAVPSLIWGPMVAHMPYFLIGIAAGGHRQLRGGKAVASLAAFVFLANLWLVITAVPPGASALTSALLLIFAWMVWPQVDRGGHVSTLRMLRYLGNASMVIYLTHTIFSAVLRIIMLRSGFDGAVPVLLVTTAVGLVGPLVLLFAARKLRVVKLLGF
ncbi:acyltransferase [Sulfitobacter sp. F26169L]|uniref:acyltransferase family protein n=1 Tax=Sulfitobacter sp. F26169L TaxID=2996015 RepID=UPI002260DDE4|nr:acyltransferase [Sulfitobacter sp. F26169L]MCX7566830.1 acyltransferase [Sulfitobacter sp. F26169L]